MSDSPVNDEGLSPPQSPPQSPLLDPSRMRTVRSFVRREGRITDAQQAALDRQWLKYGIDFPGESYDPERWFGRVAPLVVEIGFGTGDHLAGRAALQPEANFLGIEVHRPGVGRLLQQVVQRDLRNVRAMCADAVEVLSGALPAGSVDTVYILFPDPWPKKRHNKRRIIQPAFADVLARALRPGGILNLATDWQDYAQHMREVMDHASDFENVASALPAAERDADQFAQIAPQQGFMQRPTQREVTRFEARGLRLGHQIFDLSYRRR